MKKLLFLAVLGMLTMLVAAPAFAQQGPACPAGQVNVLQQDGTYVCVPANVGDQTPEQIEAVTNDPRPNAETPIVENQGTGTIQPGTREACEGIANQAEFEECVAPFDTPPETQPTEPVAPVPAPVEPMTTATTSAALPDTGGPALLMPLLGVLLVAGGLVMRRR